MPELQEMCGELVVSLSDAHAEDDVDALEISDVALSSHALDLEESGYVVLPRSIGHVVSLPVPG
jgi:hypothetical protein